MIKRVKLKNWRCHSDSDLEFSRGTNALLGKMGAGKSSVLNAISFGLFGTFPDLQTRRVKLDDVIMNKPQLKEDAHVTVDFVVDGKEYSVMRILERGKGTTHSEIREGDKLLEAPSSSMVTEMVEKLLKVNYELFSKAVYSEQNALDYFLRLPKGERMRRIDNLLMIDKFESARSSTVSLRNKLLERKMGKASVVDQTDDKKLRKDLESIDSELKGLRENKEELSKRLKSVKEEKSKVEERLKELEALNQTLISLEKERESIESLVEENKRMVNELRVLLRDKKPEDIKERLETLQRRVKKFEEELKAKRGKYDKLTKLISESRTRIEFMEKERIEKLTKEIDEKTKIKKSLIKIQTKYGDPLRLLEKRREELDEKKGQIASILTTVEEIKKILEQVRELKDHCPVCLSILTDDKKQELIARQSRKLEETRATLRKMREEKSLKEREVKDLEEIVNSFKDGSSEIKNLGELQEKLKETKRAHLELKANVERSEDQYEKLKLDLDKIQRSLGDETKEKQELESLISKISELKTKMERLSELESKEKEIVNTIEEISKKIGEENLEELRSQFRGIIGQESKLETRITSLDEIVEEKGGRRKEYEGTLELIDSQKAEIKRLEDIIKDLRAFEKALKQTQVHLRKRFINAVNDTMNRIWSSLYPYEDFTGIKLDVEERDYVLRLRDRFDRWANVDGIASGGERTIASLALRISFSLVLAPQLRWLVLDEPTHNLDVRAVEDLSGALRERIGDFIDQVFLITHDEKLEDAVTGNLYKLDREKERDGITKISESF